MNWRISTIKYWFKLCN